MQSKLLDNVYMGRDAFCKCIQALAHPEYTQSTLKTLKSLPENTPKTLRAHSENAEHTQRTLSGHPEIIERVL